METTMHPGADSAQLRAELAVMRLFRHLGVPAEVFLSIEEIAAHWRRYGVRATDLPGAIDRLVARGLLVRRQDDRHQVACTVAGANWFDEQPGWLEYHLLVPRIARARFVGESGDHEGSGARRLRGSGALRERKRA
jgi:hypothetical protein